VIIQRKKNAASAILGNLEHSKIQIYFEDDSSKRWWKQPFWALTDESVVLKRLEFNQ
jgi:hypothetical protein